MSEMAMNAAKMLDMLPEQEQAFAYEIIKRLVLAWDPDYTKLTPAEEADLQQATQEAESGECYTLEEVEAMLNEGDFLAI